MAAVVNLPRAPETSLGRLGDVIFASAADYSDKRRADDREARLRAQRLQDVESERGYVRTEGDRQFDRARTNQLTDIQGARDYEKEIYQRNLGDKRTDVYDERAWQLYAAQLERQIKDNPAGVEIAQARLNVLATERDQARQQMRSLEQTLSQPEPQPDPVRIQNEAIKRATAMIPPPKGLIGQFGSQRTVPTREEIAAIIPAIEEEERARINASWQRARMDAQIQYQTLAAVMQNVGAESNTITNVFRRVGIADGSGPAAAASPLRSLSEPGASVTPTGGAPNLAAVQQSFVEGIRQQLAKKGAPASAPTQAPSPVAPAGPAASLVEPVDFPPVATPISVPPATTSQTPSNWGRMRNMEPGYNPLTLLTGNTPDRLAEIAKSNAQRSAWNAGGGVIGQIDPVIEAKTLQTRLLGIADKTSVAAQTIVNRLRQLENSFAQQATRSSQLLEPMNTAVDTVPPIARRGLGARQLFEPAY